ncbi:hypothetical protein KP509_33G057700 [Ceratopteris richardii]|nr:hypothetical protein KP509_33G057700 [Ceratopteris richardii]
MHVDKAAKMFVQSHTWRTSFVPQGYIPIDHITSELNANKCALQGYSKEGYPLVIGFGAKHYPGESSLETFKKYVVYILDKTIASASARGTEKIAAIGDLKDMAYKNVDLKAYIAAFQILQDYYPERLAKLYLINAPNFFIGIWKLVSRFLDQPTKDKICVLSNDVIREVLLSDVDVETLPSDYGGKAELLFIQDVDVPNFPRQVASVPA